MIGWWLFRVVVIMGVLWFRIVMMIVMMFFDDVEGVCVSIVYVILSWFLCEFFGIC